MGSSRGRGDIPSKKPSSNPRRPVPDLPPHEPGCRSSHPCTQFGTIENRGGGKLLLITILSENKLLGFPDDPCLCWKLSSILLGVTTVVQHAATRGTIQCFYEHGAALTRCFYYCCCCSG